MEANFRLSKTEYKEIAPYKIKGINIYSIEEAIYLFYNKWKDINCEFFEDSFINWVKNEILDLDLYEKLIELKKYESFYKKSISFLTINNFYNIDELKQISKDLINWEKRGKSQRLKALADRFFNENSFERAIKIYLEITNIEQKNPIIYNNLAICYIRINQYKLAFKYLEKAFYLDSKNQTILNNLIETIILNKDKEKFDKYVCFVDTYNDYYYFLAEFNKYEKDYGNSLSNYAKSYLFKRDKNILLKICDIYIINKNYKKALDITNFFKEDLFYILIKKSEIYENMKNYTMARKCLEKANFYERNNGKIWLKLAKFYRLEYDLIKSEGAIFKAKSILQESQELLYEQALLKKAQGKFKEYQGIMLKIIKKSNEQYRKYFNE